MLLIISCPAVLLFFFFLVDCTRRAATAAAARYLESEKGPKAASRGETIPLSVIMFS